MFSHSDYNPKRKQEKLEKEAVESYEPLQEDKKPEKKCEIGYVLSLAGCFAVPVILSAVGVGIADHYLDIFKNLSTLESCLFGGGLVASLESIYSIY